MSLAYMCLIFFLSSESTVPGPVGEFNLATPLHVLEYAILGVLLSAALGLEKWAVVFAVLIASVYGVSDEFHQSFVPGRSASLMDAVWDSLGAVVGSASAFLLKGRL